MVGCRPKRENWAQETKFSLKLSDIARIVEADVYKRQGLVQALSKLLGGIKRERCKSCADAVQLPQIGGLQRS